MKRCMYVPSFDPSKQKSRPSPNVWRFKNTREKSSILKNPAETKQKSAFALDTRLRNILEKKPLFFPFIEQVDT
jgi:hypothetical protein